MCPRRVLFLYFYKGGETLPEPREKPRMEKPKTKSPSALSPKQAARVLASSSRPLLEQRVPGEENETEYATDRAEGAAKRAAKEMSDGIRRSHNRNPKTKAQRQARQSQQSPGAGGTEPRKPSAERTPGEQQVVETKKRRSRKQTQADIHRMRNARQQLWNKKDSPKEKPDIRQDNSELPTARDPTKAQTVRPMDGQTNNQVVPNSTVTAKRPPVATGTWEATDIPSASHPHGISPKERTRATAATLKTRENIRAAAKTAGKNMVPGARSRRTKAAAQTFRRIKRNAQRQMTRKMVAQARKTAKTAVVLMKKVAVAVTKAAARLFASLVGLSGGGFLLIVLVVVFIVAAIGNSPFGLFFAEESSAPDTISVSEAVSTVSMALGAKLEELQSVNYDSIIIEGQAADWPEVLAVFASKTAGTEDGVDVATLDADRVQRLTNVFWDMTAVSSEVETIYHPGSSEDDPGWTEYILHITVTAKTADDMRTQYNFTKYQNSALDELLAERDALTALIGSLTITNADVSAILDALPDDLCAERRETVETALTLVGKVNYFWGGKSSAIGWDSRWGTLQKVTAADSPTTGIYRPYGLDCSGYVDWVFNNSLGYVIGHGGGAASQHTYCTNISWEEAQPGDLAFYPDDSHVGIVVGRSDTGGILVAHCSSGHNNVVVSDCAAGGFTAIGRPNIFD
jgi:cell wall-associated NlpC family hydrolase